MKLDLRIIVALATKFPNLEFLGCQTGSFEWCSTTFLCDYDKYGRNQQYILCTTGRDHVVMRDTISRKPSLPFVIDSRNH
jgi:hypothetical protein